MAQGKKISELTEVSSVTDNDEFLFVDKEGSGADSGVGGKTAKIKFSNLKASFGNLGEQGEKGEKGDAGPRGLDGVGTQYWTQSPTDGDAVYYDAGNVGIGTDAPRGVFHVQPTSDRPFTVSSTGMVGIGVSQGGMNMGSDLSQYHLELASHSLGGPTLGLHNYRNDLTELGKINFLAGQGDGIVTAQIIGSRDFGDGSGSSLRFLTKGANADPVQERMIISANGNVGIGTDAPVGNLHIETSDDGTALGPDVILMRESTNPVAGGLLGSLRYQGRTHSANGAIKVEYADIKAEIADPAGGGKLVFRTRQENSGEHHTMVLDNNGNVGIGTNDPKAKLHIVSDSDNSVVAKFTRPFAEGATLEATYNYESYVSVQAGYVDDVHGDQSTVRIGARRSANSNEASLVLQTVGAGRPAGDKFVDRMYISNGQGHTYIYGEMNNDSLNLGIDGTSSLLNLVNREPVVDETSVNPVGITFKSVHSSDETKPITTRAAIYATREASSGTPNAVSGKLHFAVNNHGSQLSDAMTIAPSGSVYFENSAVVRRSFANEPAGSENNSAILNVVNSTVADNHRSKFIVYGNGNTMQGGPQQLFNADGPYTNNTASSCMWSQKLTIPASTTAGTGGYTHYVFNIGNYVYGKFTIMAARTNASANYAFAEYIVSNNSGTLHSTALNEKLIGGNVEMRITPVNNNQTGLGSNQCQLKIAMNQEGSSGSITVFWQGSSPFASTAHDDSHTNW